MWEGIREVMNIKKTKGQVVNALNNGEDIRNKNNKIAEKFNNHSCKIAEAIENKIPKAKNQFSDYLKNEMEQSLFINPTISDKIESQIKDVKNHKAGVLTVSLKQYLEISEKNINVPLTELINLSFNQGKFPAELKIARVRPSFKKVTD